MLAYAIRRVLYTVPVLLGVAVLVFLLFHSVGEDPVRIALGTHATPEAIAELRAQWGLDKPLVVQLWDFFGQIVTFDYGVSFNSGEKLSTMFIQGAAVSLFILNGKRTTDLVVIRHLQAHYKNHIPVDRYYLQ